LSHHSFAAVPRADGLSHQKFPTPLQGDGLSHHSFAAVPRADGLSHQKFPTLLQGDGLSHHLSTVELIRFGGQLFKLFSFYFVVVAVG
jgi:hypothetical protein